MQSAITLLKSSCGKRAPMCIYRALSRNIVKEKAN